MFFHTLTFVGYRGSCLNTRPFKHRPRDLASVNAMKQTCMIIILAYYTWFQPKPHSNRHLNIKISLFLHGISLNKMASASNFRMSYAFPCNVMQTNRGHDRLCQVKAMFKQHENLMICLHFCCLRWHKNSTFLDFSVQNIWQSFDLNWESRSMGIYVNIWQ